MLRSRPDRVWTTPTPRANSGRLNRATAGPNHLEGNLMNRSTLALALLATVSSTLLSAANTKPEVMHKVSLGGIINPATDDTLAFTSDGQTVFFDRSEGPHKTIMISHRVAGHWSPPQVASFSGRWFDQDPVISPDGHYMLFNSDRPTRPGGKPLTQTYFQTGGPGANIWRVDRKGDRWGKPVWLGPRINNDVFVDFASIAGDGTLYFMRWDAPNRNMQLWRAGYHDGYDAPERVIFGDPTVSIHDPAVARDQSFIVFDYGKVKGGLGRLSIAFRQGAGWSRPIDMGDAVNADIPWGSHLSLDGRSVYVTGNSGIWRLSLEPWLERSHPASESR
jgi:hypothetical protein